MLKNVILDDVASMSSYQFNLHIYTIVCQLMEEMQFVCSYYRLLRITLLIVVPDMKIYDSAASPLKIVLVMYAYI